MCDVRCCVAEAAELAAATEACAGPVHATTLSRGREGVAAAVGSAACATNGHAHLSLLGCLRVIR